MKFLSKAAEQGRQFMIVRAALASTSLVGMVLAAGAGGHWH